MDPRLTQILILSGALVYGTRALGFAYDWTTIGAVLSGAVLCQYLLEYTQVPTADRWRWRSALISALSICLLVRVSAWWWLACVVLIAIGSKYVVRVRGQHIFNPTNIAIVALLLAGDGNVWLSSGQWGRSVWIGLILGGAGMLMLARCKRLDLAALCFGLYACMLFGRAWYHGDPWAIPLNHMQSGSLAVFCLFMVTDPKTTPDTFKLRVVFAGVIVAVAGYVQFWLYAPNGIFYGLAVACSLRGLSLWWLDFKLARENRHGRRIQEQLA